LKYFLVILLFAFALVLPVFAQESTFAFNLSAGYLGYGGNFPTNDVYSSEASLSILSLGIEHRATNVGFEISPYTYTSWSTSGDLTDSRIDINSFLYAKLYWNVITFGDILFLGPFASVNYMYMKNDEFNWDRLTFTAGGHIGVRINFKSLYYNLLYAELGYRNIDGKSKYYIGGKVDIIALCLFWFLSD
jgi:hypothetical protein